MNSDVGASLSLLLTSIALAMYFSTVIDVEDMLPHESSFVVAVLEWAFYCLVMYECLQYPRHQGKTLQACSLDCQIPSPSQWYCYPHINRILINCIFFILASQH